MVVQHNISAMTANRYYGINNKGLAGSLEKLASGYAINKAGDNAAGLAVSEKMRAQIGGLTQASKNAEDGISLVQTMEGALQETDSILQRMRTLAVQSANGSYQDDVDREAMQLEFDQLNDELNQIADTDFNGTVMLNGGEMADGLKAINGKFNYAASQAEPHQLKSSEISSFDSTKFGAKNKATTAAVNADAAWKAWSTSAGAWDRGDTSTTNDGPESFEITFEYDGKGSWKATKASDAGINLTKVNDSLTTTPDDGQTYVENSNASAKTTNGGFTLYSAKADATGATEDQKVADVVVDTSKLQAGDTVVLKFENPVVKNYAPGNITMAVASNTAKTKESTSGAGDEKSLSNAEIAASIRVGTGTTAANIYKTKDGQGTMELTETAAKSYNALKDATVGVTYNAGKVSKVNFSLADGSEISLNTTAAATGSLTTKDGTKLSFAAAQDTGVTQIKDADGKVLFEITPAAGDAGTYDAQKANTGTVKFSLGFETVEYSKSAKPNVTVSDPTESGVSKSNAFDQSKATMTYSDHLSLQVGARTKDLVDFSFSYKSNGLGDLKANMNCSARTDGLGTADLSIADQKSANDAIDKIDNAINKISMVRATFGAAQNRLEHKINNIDTNTENLTAAESRIRDTQMDKEMMKFTSAQILSQASQSMLAQANSLPQGVLQLLG